LAAKNLARFVPNPEFLASRLSGLLDDPQRGVRGWSALHLAPLFPENVAFQGVVRQILQWEGNCWGNGLFWVDSFHAPRDWLEADSWCHLAVKTLG
jgi:hypothetical protein